MKKNIFIVLTIFLVPLFAYFILSHNKVATQPTIAANGIEVIKFSSPMCYECQELEKVFEEVFPEFNRDVGLRKIDVTQNDNQIKTMIKTYNVKLVPTTVFKDAEGNIKHRIEGTMEPQVLRNYIKELING